MAWLGGAARGLFDRLERQELEAPGARHGSITGLHPGVAVRDARDVEAGAHLVVGGEHPFGVRDDEVTRRVAKGHLDLGDRRTLAIEPRRRRDSTVRSCGPCPRSPGTIARGARMVAQRSPRATSRTPPPPSRATAAGRARRSEQTTLGEVGGVGEAGRLADHDSNTRAAIASGAELFDPSLIEQRRRRAPILDEDLGEVTAAAHRFVEHSLHDFLFDEIDGHEGQRIALASRRFREGGVNRREQVGRSRGRTDDPGNFARLAT